VKLEAGAFYYSVKDNILAYCATEGIYFGRVSLNKVNANDSEDCDISCSLEFFEENFRKVAFLTSKEVQG
jgi:hypothetical protein